MTGELPVITALDPCRVENTRLLYTQPGAGCCMLHPPFVPEHGLTYMIGVKTDDSAEAASTDTLACIRIGAEADAEVDASESSVAKMLQKGGLRDIKLAACCKMSTSSASCI